MLTLLLASLAGAATLPGVPVPFDVTEDGRWVLSEDLPQPMRDAGAEPGWQLMEVDGIPFDDPDAVSRRVATGPARPVQLVFYDAPEEGAEDAAETVVVARRRPLVQAVQVAYVAFPDTMNGFGSWREDPSGAPVLSDGSDRHWVLDTSAGSLAPLQSPSAAPEHRIPDVFWERSKAGWVFDSGRGVLRARASTARERLASAARLSSFKGRSGEHVVVPDERGLRVWALRFPDGTPRLPTCQARVPETCLASGREILAELGTRPGGPEEALRQLGVACDNGVHRACYEAVALEQPTYAVRVDRCIGGDVTACNEVARDRYELDPSKPDDQVLGLLDHACQLEGAESLGERLRSVDDIGESCMRLADSYEVKGMPDLALLNLDQACVLGRADACNRAEDRRKAAFAARMVRECQSGDTPIPTSCVELGGVLERNPAAVSPVDPFDAYLRGCELGAVRGCIALSDYVDRWGIEHPRVKAAEQKLSASCDSGEQRSCIGTAYLLSRHEPRTKAYGDALTLFSAACDAGLAEGCIGGANQRRIGRARAGSAPTQADMWQSACDGNAPEGCAGLGEELARSNKKDAFAAWNRACTMGDAGSCSSLGSLVQTRHSPAWPDEQAPEAYLSQGCEQGDPEGCYLLAARELPRRGEPTESSYNLLDRSCEGEYGVGCARLAQVHLDRKSNADDEIAAGHLETACLNGSYESCRTLGTMYAKGKGVERDRQRAGELFQLFRYKAPRRHLRLGPVIGLPYAIGAEGEVVLPLPVGPGISVGGHASFVPLAGGSLLLLKAESVPVNSPDLSIYGFNVRVYPNPQARGLYGSVGFHQFRAGGGELAEGEELFRSGWNARIGLRSQSKTFYTSLEIGLGTYGNIDINDFDDLSTGQFPLLLPSVGLSMGLAVF